MSQTIQNTHNKTSTQMQPMHSKQQHFMRTQVEDYPSTPKDVEIDILQKLERRTSSTISTTAQNITKRGESATSKHAEANNSTGKKQKWKKRAKIVAQVAISVPILITHLMISMFVGGN
jgi:hypothetical protein